MAKKPTPSSALVKTEATKLYPIAGTTIVPTQLFRVPSRQPAGDGPWRSEPDKLAWIDKATGYPCIILRGKYGALSGYVAVNPVHSLFGYNYRAVPAALGIKPHGGLNYSAECDQATEERVSVCHLHQPTTGEARRTRGEPERPAANADEWWFGFSCDKSYDYVPRRDPIHMSPENGQTYRDENYVFEQCTDLAAQLAAADAPTDNASAEDAVCGVPLDLGTTIPPIGLDKREK